MNRGLLAAATGDLSIAKATLDQVARVPGEDTPISGLSPEAEARFYELVGRVAALATATGVAENAPALVPGPTHHYSEDGIEVHSTEGTHHVALDDGSELFTTVQTYQATVGPDASPSPESQLDWLAPTDRPWSRCQVEEIRLVRTTVHYDPD